MVEGSIRHKCALKIGSNMRVIKRNRVCALPSFLFENDKKKKQTHKQENIGSTGLISV